MSDKNGKTFSDLLFSSENHSNDESNDITNKDSENISLMNVISNYQDTGHDDVDNNNDVSSSSIFSDAISLNNNVVDSNDSSTKSDDGTVISNINNENGNESNEDDAISNNKDNDFNLNDSNFFDSLDSDFSNVYENSNESNVDSDTSQDKEIVSNLDSGMFFDNQNSSVEEINVNDMSNVDLGNSMFFDNTESDNDNAPNNGEQFNQNVPSNNIEAELKMINEKKEEVVETSNSQNPFFEEDSNKDVSFEANPLFLNTLNLVESDNMKKKVDVIDPSKSKHFNVKIVRKKEPLFKVIIGVISYAIFIWLLFIGVTLLIYVLDIKIRAYKGDYSTPTYNAYVVLTGSMLPEIQVYDVVVTKKADAANLKIGDVITFSSADSRFLGTTITHRIIKKNYSAETKSYTFQTKGDNNNVADSALVPQSNIYGKVILKIPKLGYLQEFLASDGGWIIVILIPCLAVLSFDIVKLAKGLKRKKYKNIKVQK